MLRLAMRRFDVINSQIYFALAWTEKYVYPRKIVLSIAKLGLYSVYVVLYKKRLAIFLGSAWTIPDTRTELTNKFKYNFRNCLERLSRPKLNNLFSLHYFMPFYHLWVCSKCDLYVNILFKFHQI